MGEKVQPAVKKETMHVSIYTAIGVVIMYGGFWLAKALAPDTIEIPVGYTVILAGIAGGLVAVLNFFLMGLAVQKVASTENEDDARNIMKKSYSRRMLLQILWIIAALAAPCFQVVAGILPLLFPTLGIKIMNLFSFKKSNRQEVEQKQDGD